MRYYERLGHVLVRHEERSNGGLVRYYERQNHVLVRSEDRANGGLVRYYEQAESCFGEK